MFYWSGLLLGLSIIVGIGMQNIFIIRQGVMRQHHYLVAFLSALCDSFLVVISMLGTASLLAEWPQMQTAMIVGAIVFLVVYGSLSWRSAYRHHRSSNTVINSETMHQQSMTTILLASLGFSVLNPQAILDVFIILGGASTQYHGTAKVWFMAGVISASFIWFFTLAMLASRCHKHFKTPRTWAWLEGISGTLMLGIAFYFLRSL